MARFIPLFTFTFALHLATSAAIPVRWTVDTFRVKPLVYDCYHGETLDLAAAMTAYGDPLDLHGKAARLYWQTNGMDSVYWSTNATIKADTSTVHLSPTPTPTNILAATFSGSFDPGAPSVSGFIGVEGENYRAAFQLNFRASPGFAPAHLPIPTPVIDFATTAVANPEASPFMVKGGSGGIDASTATNIASAVVAPIASTQSVHSATLSSHSSQLSQLSQSVNAKISKSNGSGQSFDWYEGNLVGSGNMGVRLESWDRYLAGNSNLSDYLFGGEWATREGTLPVIAKRDWTDARYIIGSYDGNNFTTWYVGKFVNGISIDSDGDLKITKHDNERTDENVEYSFSGWNRGIGEFSSILRVDGSAVLTQNKGDSRYLQSYTETDPTATTKAQAAIASALSGRTYDFANGSNFTKNLYTALTNVIQTLGGTVTNPPNFN